ncbi:hypothetical protein [Aureimonas pseudogalii]|uniref:Uncharacterized protein n=1 Tax=Aureimonas pseudogalii TaxID=1744844 RepID=A0A7W6H7S4_9HYPH|nr:hypothetical protein [Aureimonas pseudogalii]MBB4000209.1 hypothetical protein [Aureimonas pseudogalii]
MRREGRVRPLALALALGWLASSTGTGVAAAEPRIAYAPHKLVSPFRTDRAGAQFALPGDLPRRGALVATGNALSPTATWIIVDLDARTLRRATTRLSDATRHGKPTTVIEHDASRDLTASEIDAAIAAANAVWATRDPAPIDAPGPTDALCSVALFDGGDVLHEFGAACPRAQFVQMLRALTERSR